MDSARHRLRVVAGGSDPDAHQAPLDLDEAFRQYAPYVARIALRLLGRHDEVEDLVQDVFLDAHRGLRNLRQPGAIKGWLATVTVRRARRRLRARGLRRFLGLDAVASYGALVDPGSTPEDRALVSAAYSALDGLPADLRTAWILRHVEGENLDSVADLCDCSRATAHRRVVAAGEALRQVLDG